MIRRTAVSLSVALLLLAGACGDDDDEATPSSSTAAPATTGQAGTSSTSSPSSTAPTSVSTTDTTEVVPPPTPPADQPEACVVLAAAAGLDVTTLEVDDRPSGTPAPSTGCRDASGVSLALFYGQDPLETLALARVQNPVGSDATGVGQDAYQSGGVLYVDTGSRAFAVTGGGRPELVALAQAVIANL